MKIHEYQAKQILQQYGVPTPRGIVARTVDEAEQAARELGGSIWVVKAQIHAGGRGLGGGVKLARNMAEVRGHADDILGMQLITHQTGPKGQKVRKVYIEEGVDIARELYLGLTLDRQKGRLCLMASTEGGTSIEEVAEHTPELIHKVWVDPSVGFRSYQANQLGYALGLSKTEVRSFVKFATGLYRVYTEKDASLAEINPLVVTGDGDVIALDCKLSFDDNGLHRHPEIVELRDLDEEDPSEVEAGKFELSYINLDGDIGCLVNGAGLAMATMDTLQHYGGSPANFLDVGGSATAERVSAAFRIILRDQVHAILVNIFGGIMKCDTIAEGVITAVRDVGLEGVPLVVRLAGTNVELGKKLLAESGLPIATAESLSEGAQLAVQAARQHAEQQ
jgi:succinyl-CoA synthetase beta subunit